jgi:hypothetical protein
VEARRRRWYARFLIRLPQIDMLHHAADRFFERSKNTYPHWRQPFMRDH